MADTSGLKDDALINRKKDFPVHIFFSVGEPSGDQHATHLIAEIRRQVPHAKFSGFGGPLMEQAGCETLFRLTNLAVMGIIQVIPHLVTFFKLVAQANRYFQEQRPDVVVLVDFPGFNWWIARKAKRAGIPVIYYLPPQLWAWGSWRIRRVHKFVDHVLCALPFEQKWYSERGVSAQNVGHPFFDEVARYQLDESLLASWRENKAPTVGILPGSRQQEIDRCWPDMVQAMKLLHEQVPDVRFLVACYRDKFRQQCSAIAEAEAADLPIEYHVRKTSEIIEAADCCLMVSGSVSLEMLARTTPAAVIYRVDWLFHQIAKRVITCKYMSLPNLIAEREILPEFIPQRDPKEDVTAVSNLLTGWLNRPVERERVAEELAQLKQQVGASGASEKAASAILSYLDVQPQAKAA